MLRFAVAMGKSGFLKRDQMALIGDVAADCLAAFIGWKKGLALHQSVLRLPLIPLRARALVNAEFFSEMHCGARDVSLGQGGQPGLLVGESTEPAPIDMRARRRSTYDGPRRDPYVDVKFSLYHGI